MLRSPAVTLFVFGSEGDFGASMSRFDSTRKVIVSDS